MEHPYNEQSKPAPYEEKAASVERAPANRKANRKTPNLKWSDGNGAQQEACDATP